MMNQQEEGYFPARKYQTDTAGRQIPYKSKIVLYRDTEPPGQSTPPPPQRPNVDLLTGCLMILMFLFIFVLTLFILNMIV